MTDGIKYVGSRQHLYDDEPPTFPNGKVDHWKQFVQKNKKLDKLEKDHTNKLASKIVDKHYQQNKNKSPFTQVAENAAKELSFRLKDGLIENNAGTQRLDNVKEAIEINTALDKNFQNQKEDDYLKKLKHFGVENSQTKHPDYPKVSNPRILQTNINDRKTTNPTVNKYKAFKENQKKKLEDKKFDEQFKKDYSDQAMENYVRGKVNKNIRAGKAPYEDLPTSYLIVGEHAKDKAKKKLAEIKIEHIKLEPSYIDYRLSLKESEPRITLEQHMAKVAPREIDEPGITALEGAKDFKRTFDAANRNTSGDKYNGIGPLLGEYNAD